MNNHAELPVAVIGAGPVGLAAAAHLVERGLTPVVLERAPSVGAALRDWGHVRVFSPWRYNIDAAARALLERSGWREPDLDALPTGAEIVRDYLEPLAALPEIAPHLVAGASVTAVTRLDRDKLASTGREALPFMVRYKDGEGAERRIRARAVIDASGTWTQPNPIGVDGFAVDGEAVAGGRVAYGIPDVAGAEREAYAGRRVLIVGGGHSAANAALALLRVQDAAPRTEVFWALRNNRIDRLVGGGRDDQLPERGALGLAAKRAIEAGRLEVLAPFAVERVAAEGDALAVSATLDGAPRTLTVDRIVVATGFRPDVSFLRELRVELDPVVEAPPALAPLIDPNLHSCGTVPPHGVAELAHPEPDFFIVGSKAYGRAPTFLMATGYEQVRSVAAALAGDFEAARDVRLVLPETGACQADAPVARAAEMAPAEGCCGGSAPAGVDACCLADAEAKADGEAGCGCGEKAVELAAAPAASSCCGSAA